jgi:hypothetical protein
MSRPLQLASGISVVLSTLAFSHIMFHDTVHMVTDHRARTVFIAIHTILAVIVAGLSLTGAYFLLTGKRRQSSN